MYDIQVYTQSRLNSTCSVLLTDPKADWITNAYCEWAALINKHLTEIIIGNLFPEKVKPAQFVSINCL